MSARVLNGFEAQVLKLLGARESASWSELSEEIASRPPFSSVLEMALERLKGRGQIARYPGCLYAITQTGRARLAMLAAPAQEEV